MGKRKNRAASQSNRTQRPGGSSRSNSPEQSNQAPGNVNSDDSAAEAGGLALPGIFAALENPAPPRKRWPILLTSIVLWVAFLAFLLVAATIG